MNSTSTRISTRRDIVPEPDRYSTIFQYESLRITLPFRNV